jgi:hypothetical protein
MALLAVLAYAAAGAPGQSASARQNVDAMDAGFASEPRTFRNATDKDAVVHLHVSSNGDPLSGKLDLVVRDATTGRVAYTGSLHRPSPIEVDRLGPGETGTYTVGLVVAKGSAETFAAEKAATSVDWAWTVSGG